MRDGQIINATQILENKIQVIYRQLQFLNTRMNAYDLVLSKKWNLLWAIFAPSWFMKQVDAFQAVLLQKQNEELKKAVEEAKKPKVTLLNPLGVAICLILLFSGCVPKYRYVHDIYVKDIEIKTLRDQCTSDLTKVVKEANDYFALLKNEINLRTERLRKFKQVDADGNLIPLKK